jgi:hypothetical protein
MGFTGAFGLFGGFELLSGLLVLFLLPQAGFTNILTFTLKEMMGGFFHLLRYPPIALFVFSTFVTGFGTDYLTAVLEPALGAVCY